MLPPGHIAAGYLTAKALLHFAHPNISPSQTNQLILWGMFWGFAPDLDYFWCFIREKAFIVRDVNTNNHRKFISHAPIVWLLAGLLIFFASANPFWKTFGLLVWLGSWSHFILDTIEYGIMWLWPLTDKKYALRLLKDVNIEQKSFLSYWWAFVKAYAGGISFYLEVVIIIAALIIYFK